MGLGIASAPLKEPVPSGSKGNISIEYRFAEGKEDVTAAPGAVRGAEGDAGQRATQELTRRAPERTPRAPRRARRVSPRGS